MNKKIYILGHDKPDVDSIVSGIILSKYLSFLNLKSEYIIPVDKIDEESLPLLKLLNINYKSYIKDIPNCSRLILVDHHESKYSLNNTILAVIDHHPTIKKFNYPKYININASSTSKIVYDIIQESNPDFISDDIKYLVLVATLVDTASFKNSKTNPDDISWSLKTCKELNINFSDVEKLGFCLTDLNNLQDIYYNGSKEFIYDSIRMNTSYIRIDNENLFLENEIIYKIYSEIKNSNYDLWVFLIYNIKENHTKEYRIFKNKIEYTKHDSIPSRGSYIVPKIEKSIQEKKIEF